MAGKLITVVIASAHTRCRVTGSSERKAALTAEGLMRQTGADAGPLAFWVECEDGPISERLASYLTGVRSEILAEPTLMVRLPPYG